MTDINNSFKPMLSPKEMLQKGIFGGTYFNKLVDYRVFPKDWFLDLDQSYFLSKNYNKKINYFNIKSGQSQEEWEAKGWIHKDDPRGWFEWYCRYYMGRRIPEEDERQIKRWKAIRRHISQITRNCRPGDINCRPVQRQAVLHWAYDSRKL